MLLLAGFLLVPAVLALSIEAYDDAQAFGVAALASFVFGLLACWRNRAATLTAEGRPDFFRREGLAAVGLCWLAVPLFGALPYLLTGSIAAPVDAVFESVSGFTTTGSTILEGPEIDALSVSVAFWRSFTHWLGGIGIVLVFVVFFPVGGRSLFRSEVPGVAREATQRRVRDSALGLARIYLGLTMVIVAALMFCGLPLYEATLHSFGTIATGGFSNHSNSVAHFASRSVEAVLVVFMFMAGINFAIYDTFLRQGWRGAWKAASGSPELRAYASLMLVTTVLIAGVLWFTGGSNGLDLEVSDAGGAVAASLDPDYSSLQRCVRDSTFAVVSVQTSTGYTTADFNRWPEFCKALLLLLAFTGACAGSTGGGLKMIRFMIVLKAAVRSVRAFSRPRAIETVRIGNTPLDEEVVGAVTGYFSLWIVIFVGGTLALTALDMDILTSATAVLATLNNIGPGLQALGPYGNFAEVPLIGKGLLTLFMILGRLEFYALVVLLVPRFWRS